jgi:hypothetical protein
MKKLSTAVLLAALCLSSAALMAEPKPPAQPQPMNHCPRIHEAQETLRHAREELDHAGHDFCGHKEDAIHAIDHALEELRKAENCDRCR